MPNSVIKNIYFHIFTQTTKPTKLCYCCLNATDLYLSQLLWPAARGRHNNELISQALHHIPYSFRDVQGLLLATTQNTKYKATCIFMLYAIHKLLISADECQFWTFLVSWSRVRTQEYLVWYSTATPVSCLNCPKGFLVLSVITNYYFCQFWCWGLPVHRYTLQYETLPFRSYFFEIHDIAFLPFLRKSSLVKFFSKVKWSI